MNDDLRRILEDVSERARPDLGAFERLEDRRRRWENRRRITAAAVVLAILAAGSVVFVRSLGRVETPAVSPTPPALPEQTHTFRDGEIVFEVPQGWEDLRSGPGTLRLVRDLPSGGQVELFAWDLKDERVRPLDPLTGEVGPPAATRQWFGAFSGREDDLPPYPSQRGGFISYWASGHAAPLLWLLSFEGVDIASVERSDYRIDGHFTPRASFDLGASTEVLQTEGGPVALPAGRVWVWYSPISDLHLILGYVVSGGGDPLEGSSLASEVLRSTTLPRPT